MSDLEDQGRRETVNPAPPTAPPEGPTPLPPPTPCPPPLAEQGLSPEGLRAVREMLDEYCDRMNFQRQLAKIQNQFAEDGKKRKKPL